MISTFLPIFLSILTDNSINMKDRYFYGHRYIRAKEYLINDPLGKRSLVGTEQSSHHIM